MKNPLRKFAELDLNPFTEFLLYVVIGWGFIPVITSIFLKNSALLCGGLILSEFTITIFFMLYMYYLHEKIDCLRESQDYFRKLDSDPI